jgi:hypothetical protein
MAKKREPKILAIDPGLHKAGLAWFKARTGELIETECIEGEGDMDTVVDAISLEMPGVFIVVIEEPQQFSGSRKGQAARNSGAVLKLIALVYSIRQMALNLGKKVVLAPVTQWKGQVPKEVMARRLSKYYDLSEMTPDEIDAVGIGRWYLEEYDG